jgi:eukaryotic-like serine/threonine-protein kinase
MTTDPAFIHRYQVIERIGRGGMGSLYLARDPLLDRLVAVKVLREEIDSEDVRERFAREGRAAARLSHVNIVTIFDVGEHEGRPFIAMEYVQGQTLQDLIRRKTFFDLAQKLEFIQELCAGLAVAHDAGIVHRDVKPSNLMITPQWVLKILDFGIARVSDSSLTQSRSLVGTLNYMAPEQMTGEKVDGRCDIFATGAVCYELLSWRQAFPGNLTDGIFERILHGEPEPIATVCPGLDPEIIRIVETALQKDRDKRYQEMSAMRKDVLRVLGRLQGRGIATEPAAGPPEGGREGDTPRPGKPARGTPEPTTPARQFQREMFLRRRDAEVEGRLAAARQAMAARDFESVIAACEQALFLDPDHDEAGRLREQAQEAIELRQVDGWLDDAQRQIDLGSLTAAAGLIDQALELKPASARGQQLRAVVAEARRERERELERREAIERALGQAAAALAERDYSRAVQCANAALAVDPSWPDALALKKQAADALEAERQREEHERAAEAVVSQARNRFSAGDYRGALAMLAAFRPPHGLVTAAFQELGGEAERLERERERAEQERAERERWLAGWLDLARKAIDDSRFDEAVEAVRQARVIDPDVREAAGLLDRVEAGRAAALAAEEERTAEQARQLAAARAAEEEARAAEEARRRAAAQAAEEDARRAEEARREAAARAEAEREHRAEEARRVAAERAAEEQRRREAAAARAEADKERKEEQARRIAAEQAASRERRSAEKAARRAARQAAADEKREVSEALPPEPPVRRTPWAAIGAAVLLVVAVGAYWLVPPNRVAPPSPPPGPAPVQDQTGTAPPEQPAASVGQPSVATAPAAPPAAKSGTPAPASDARRPEHGQAQEQKVPQREAAAPPEPGVGLPVAAREGPAIPPGPAATAAPIPAAATGDRTPPAAPDTVGAPVAPASPSPGAEQGVRDALRRYEGAYESLDAQEVKRILPSVNAQELAKVFAAYKAYVMTVEVSQIDLQGSIALATCVVKRSFTPKVGRGASMTTKSVFRLERVGGDWIVVGIDGR